MKRLFSPFDSNCLNLLFWEAVALCCYACVCDANFVFSDDNFVVRSICHGLFRKPGIMLSHGRFMPLQGLDVNLILLFPPSLRTNIPLMIYSFLAGLLAVSCCLLARVLRVSSECVPQKNARTIVPFLIFLLFLVSNDVLRDFWWNMYPESRIIFGLCVFMSAVLMMLQKNRWTSRVLMVLSAVYVSLFKENAFILPTGFACVILTFGWKRISARNRACFILVVLYALMFCAAYVVFIRPHVTVSYSAGRQITLAASFGYFTHNPLFAAALVLSLVRLYFLLLKKSTGHLVWDAALLAGVAHVASYVMLRYQAHYYVTPAYIFVAPAICHWLVIGCERFGRVVYWVVVSTAIVVIVHGAGRSLSVWFRTNLSRNSDVPGLKDLSGEARLKTVFYFHPETGLFEASDKNIFNDFWRCYVKGGKDLVTTESCPDYLYKDQAIVFPHAQRTAWKYITLARRRRYRAVQMSNYDIVYGPAEFGPMRFSGEMLEVPVEDNGSCSGFYPCEQWGRWGMSNATITISVDDAIIGKKIFARARLGALATSKRPTNTVQVLVNGHEVHKFTSAQFPLKERCFEIEPAFNDNSRLNMTFIMPGGCVCPAETGLSKDSRQLGVAFGGLELQLHPFADRRRDAKSVGLPPSFNEISGFVVSPQNRKKFIFRGDDGVNEAYLRFMVKGLKPQASQLVIRFQARSELMRQAYVRTAKSRGDACRVLGTVCEAVLDMRNCASWYWPSGFYYVGIGFPLSELRQGDEIELLGADVVPLKGSER